VNRIINPSKVTLRHHIRPVVGEDLQASTATDEVKTGTGSALQAVLMCIVVFSLMITVSCLVRVCLYVAVRKMI